MFTTGDEERVCAVEGWLGRGERGSGLSVMWQELSNTFGGTGYVALHI